MLHKKKKNVEEMSKYLAMAAASTTSSVTPPFPRVGLRISVWAGASYGVSSGVSHRMRIRVRVRSGLRQAMS